MRPEEENGSGSGFGFFETGQPLLTNISSVKVTKTFTDEIFVGNGYLELKKFIGDLTKMFSILTALNGRFNGSDQSDRRCQT